MGTLIQIKDVPEEVHAVLKSRAALDGVPLSVYVRALLERHAARPTPAELAARIRARGAPPELESSAETVRWIRDHGE
jgi:plasmid stability protein